MPDDMKKDRFRELFDAAAEERLTDAEHIEWNELLQQDSQARREYFYLANLRGTLHQRLAEREAGSETDLHNALTALLQPPPSEPTAVTPNRHRITRFAWPAAAAVLFALTLLLAFIRLRPAPAPLAQSPNGPARITGLVSVAWEDPALTLPVDTLLPPKLLRLRTGLLRLELPTGTVVILQGPAQFQVDSQSKLTLQRGKLTAHVPKKGIGFAVSTPNATVTDLGTEFGVYVNRDDQTHAEVFTGKVRLSTNTEAGASTARILQADDAAQVLDESTGIQPADPEPLAFVRPDAFAQIEQDKNNPAFARWLSFSRHLRNDSDLLAYYDFEPAAVADARLPNLAAATFGKSDGIIHSATWDQGHLPGKHALRFTGQSRVAISLPQPVHAVTLTAWINPENLEKQHQAFLHVDRNGTFASILMTSGARPGAIHWQLMDGVRTELGISVSESASIPFSRYRSMDLLSHQDDGRWMFVALVIDPRNLKIRHYLDGALAGKNNENTQDADLAFGDAEIGNWNPLHRTDHPNRGFVGRIDELAVFNRILSDEELQAIYAAGNGG